MILETIWPWISQIVFIIFFYLKECVDQKGWTLTDDLPFTSKDYNHAKNVRTANCHRWSEVANVHAQNMIQSPKIKNTNLKVLKPSKIWSKKRVITQISNLEMNGIVKIINRYARFNWDRFNVIRRNLVSGTMIGKIGYFHNLLDSWENG